LLTSALKEHCSGGSNIFHVLTFLGKPQDPVPTNTGDKKGVAARTTPRGGMLRAIMKQAMAMASGSSGMSGSMGEGLGWVWLIGAVMNLEESHWKGIAGL